MHSYYSYTACFIALKLHHLYQNGLAPTLTTSQLQNYYKAVQKHLPSEIRHGGLLLHLSPLRNWLLRQEESQLPGDLAHLLFRKWFITKQVKQALNQGYEQLILLGAGLDPYGIIAKQEHPNTRILELDTANMLDQKRRIFAETQLKSVPILLPYNANADRMRDLLPALRFFQADKPTLVISEGFLEYQTSVVVRWIAEDLSTIARPLKWISTHYEFENMSNDYLNTYRKYTKLVREPLSFPFKKQPFQKLLSENNFTYTRILSDIAQQEILQENGIPLKHMPHFHIIEAQLNA